MKLIVIYYVEVHSHGGDCDVDVDHGIVGVYKDDDSEITEAIKAKYSSDEYNIEYITLGQINYNS